MSNTLGRRIGPYREILRTIWANRDRPRYAWRILNDGVCDGCALGTTGMRDWTMDGVHLCWVRLNLLRLNTMPALDPRLLTDAASLGTRPERELRGMGRLPVPLLRRRGDAGFTPTSWENAIDMVSARIRNIDPRKLAFYLVSRGTVNETYYATQKIARFLGTNHIDNSARVCHSPSTVGLKQSVGFAATTCSYKDLMGSDLVVFLGSDVANNQPVMMKYLHLAKKEGTKVAVINPFREPGMERYWVPSSVGSALNGTEICDAFFSIRVGGDIAFINGVLKHLIAEDRLDQKFIREHTAEWEELRGALETQSFEELEREAGASRESMREFARLYGEARSAIFVWSMGITMHAHGVQNVKAIANLALARGMVGKPRSGLMPIRGHSGVQGGAEMGCAPNILPGGLPLEPDTIRQLESEWGFPVPSWRGHFAVDMIDAAHRGEIDTLYAVGSNLLGILPDTNYVREALARVPFRIHHDIVLNPQMLVEPHDTVLVLPATTRYEMAGGNTETSTERRVIFNPEIPGPRVDGAQDEWRVLAEIARRVKPELMGAIDFKDTAEIRREIARVIPLYHGIQHLRKKGDQFQWGGERLGTGSTFGFADGRARFTPLAPPRRETAPGWFQLNTRRGKQFNSMVFGERDMLVGGDRQSVILAPDDMRGLGIVDGARVRVRSQTGELEGRARTGAVQTGTAMVYWPEANILIPRGSVDPECGIPAYRNTHVEIIPLDPTSQAQTGGNPS